MATQFTYSMTAEEMYQEMCELRTQRDELIDLCERLTSNAHKLAQQVENQSWLTRVARAEANYWADRCYDAEDAGGTL